MTGKVLQILKLVVAISLTVGGAIYSFFLFLTRIDSADDFRFIVVIDLLIGLFWCLPVFLLFGNYMKRPDRRSTAIRYLAIAFLISVFFLLLHFNQVAVRGGEITLPFELLFRR